MITPQSLLLFLGIFSAFLFHLARLQFRKNRLGIRRGSDDSSLWQAMADSFFRTESEGRLATLESLAAEGARKLGMRAGLVVVQVGMDWKVLAVSGSDYSLIAGLEAGRIISRHSLYCGSAGEADSILAIDYASLSEWRRHGAFRERGWECYIGTSLVSSCGMRVGLAFFDSVPREQLFDRGEKLLVEQLAACVALHLDEENHGRSEPLTGSDLEVPAKAENRVIES